MLTLPEQLYILALRNQEGRFHYSSSGRLQYGLAGAIVMELVIREYIELGEKGQISITKKDRQELAELPLLEESLNIISKQRKKTIKQMIYKLAGWRQVYLRTRELLIARGILEEERKSFLFIPYKAYPLIEPQCQHELQEKLRLFIGESLAAQNQNQQLQPEEETFEKTIILASLVYACQLIETLFPKSSYSRAERKEITGHVKDLAEGKVYAEVVNKVIHEVQTAMIIAVSTAAVASQSSTK